MKEKVSPETCAREAYRWMLDTLLKQRQVHIQEFHAERAAPRFLKVLIKK
jgi:hypothetical protein